jgi:hypothetical protein
LDPISNIQSLIPRAGDHSPLPISQGITERRPEIFRAAFVFRE